jgi:antitoxin component of RelBE/YafQ-DinJ toxin-antitoxin module
MIVEFTHVCEGIGLSPSHVIKLFAKAIIYMETGAEQITLV